MVVASFVLGCAVERDVRRDRRRARRRGRRRASPRSCRASSSSARSATCCGPLLLIVVSLSGLSWRVAFAVGAGTVLLYGLWLMTFPFPPPPGRDAEHTAREGLRPIVRDPRVWYFGVLAMLSVRVRRGRVRVPDLVPRAGPRAHGGRGDRRRRGVHRRRARRLHHDQPARLPAAGAGDAQPDGRHHRVARRRGARRERLADRRGRARVRFRRRALLHRAQDAHRAPLPGPGRQRAGGREHDRVLGVPAARARGPARRHGRRARRLRSVGRRRRRARSC